MPTKKIMASARGEACCVRLPGVCNHNPETVVFAHLNKVRFGSGRGIKSKVGAYACSSCHCEADSRTRFVEDRREVYIAHLEGVIETLLKLIDKGLVVLK
jgi:hypothetical protein